MEKANLAQINGGLTERGNLKQAVAKQIREQGTNKFLGEFERTPKGEYVLAVADVDGKTAYLKATLAVSIADNIFDEPKTSKSKAEVEAPEVNIFG